MDKHLDENNISHFLDQVTEQISYKPLRPSIRQELEDHLEDRIQDYEECGILHHDAERKALDDMGDAVMIGTELNAAHQLRKAPALTAVSILLLLTGFAAAAYMQWSPEQNANGYLYYLPGMALLLFTSLAGFPLFVRHWKKLAALTALLYLTLIVLSLYLKIGRNIPPAVFSLTGLAYFATLSLGPVMAISIYRNSHHLKLALLTVICLIIGWVVLTRRMNYFVNNTAIAILLLTTFGTVCFMIHRGILPGRKLWLYGGSLICLTVLGSSIWAFPSGRYDIQAFLTSQSAIQDTWDDAYNGVLIQELLERTPLTHGLELTPEEMLDYGRGSWYFTKKDSNLWRYDSFQFYDETNITLWNILPQHYHNNYLIAVCIFLFGWLPGLAMVGGLLLFYWLLFSCIGKIHGKLASSVAFSCGLCLLWQAIFYVLGNFGYQFSRFPNLPLVSEGRLSILFNMLLLGLVFSAYRFDCVVEEPENFKASSAG